MSFSFDADEWKAVWGDCPACRKGLLSVLSFTGGCLVGCENTECYVGTILQIQVTPELLQTLPAGFTNR